MSYRIVLYALGWSIACLALAMLLPALAAWVEGDNDLAWSFGASAVLTGFFGGALLAVTSGSGETMDKRESYLFVVLVWIVLAGFGAVPLYFAGPQFAGIDAIFEASSGLTTTGATVLGDLDGVSSAILLWRGLLQWGGGFLTILLVIVLLSYIGIGGLELFVSALAKGEGDSLATRLAQTARALAWVYALVTLACWALLWLAGVPGLEALSLAFSTVSTGGFVTRNGGIAAFDSWAVELILLCFMLFGAVNFSLVWAAFHGRWQHIRREPELRYLLAGAAAVGVALSVYIFVASGHSALGSLRHGLFAAVSALTTTGFSSTDPQIWVGLSPVLLIGLLLVGASTGSTGGGLKLMRVAVLFKQARRELARLSHPHGVVSLRFGERRITDAVIRAVWSLFFVYILAFAAISLALALLGVDVLTALAAAAVTLTNAGPAMAGIDPAGGGLAAMPPAAKALLCVAMLLGRVELLTLLTLVNPAYWKR